MEFDNSSKNYREPKAKFFLSSWMCPLFFFGNSLHNAGPRWDTYITAPVLTRILQVKKSEPFQLVCLIHQRSRCGEKKQHIGIDSETLSSHRTYKLRCCVVRVWCVGELRVRENSLCFSISSIQKYMCMMMCWGKSWWMSCPPQICLTWSLSQYGGFGGKLGDVDIRSHFKPRSTVSESFMTWEDEGWTMSCLFDFCESECSQTLAKAGSSPWICTAQQLVKQTAKTSVAAAYLEMVEMNILGTKFWGARLSCPHMLTRVDIMIRVNLYRPTLPDARQFTSSTITQNKESLILWIYAFFFFCSNL